jgi:hypothetical protein
MPPESPPGGWEQLRTSGSVEGALDVEQLAKMERVRHQSTSQIFAQFVFLSRRVLELERRVAALEATADAQLHVHPLLRGDVDRIKEVVHTMQRTQRIQTRAGMIDDDDG